MGTIVRFREGIVVEAVLSVLSVLSRGPFPRSMVSEGSVPVVGMVVSLVGGTVGMVVGAVVGAVVGRIVSIGSFRPRQPVSREVNSSRHSAQIRVLFMIKPP